MSLINSGRRGGGLLRSERELEDMIRSVVCPTCGAPVKRPCWDTVNLEDKVWSVSHWRRKQVYEEGQ